MPSGIFSMPPEEYYKSSGVSQSALQWLIQSPAYYKWRLENPVEPTASMKLGTAVHMAILEPEKFATAYIALPEGDGRTKEVKDARAAVIAQNPGAEFLSASDYLACQEISVAVNDHSQAGQLLGFSRLHSIEQSMYWVDAKTDLLCKGRVDGIIPAESTIIDLKTCRSALPREFERSAFSLGYHIQAAYYVDGYAALTNSLPKFYFIVVEREAPYQTIVYQADDNFLEYGRREYRTLLELYKHCTETNSWPGPAWNDDLGSYEVLPLSIPNWAPYLDKPRMEVV